MESIKVSYELTDGGSTKKLTDLTKVLRDEVEGVQKASKAGGKTMSYAKLASQPTQEGIAYGQARAAGGTGAAGRDFAKQAQGLGGLVHVYATFAANLFAVSAAFNALEEAMNTTNMIKGLNQLGAVSGIALGGLAKNFAEASGGAISLRESMEATAKAMSSGMTQKQFLDLGNVAKKASQTLGIGMSDAVSRLTRGITKLEPELLDELGLFTKVGKSSEEYARKVNKSVDSLTDFEKRQAFANAVLKEGQDKFGQIEIDVNPYDKLLSSLKNTAQSILSIVNSILAPIAKIFADNTALITLALGLIATKLVKQALPALSSWRNGLKGAAEDAAKRAQEINTSFGEAFVERFNAKFKLPEIKQNIASITEELKQVDKEFAKSNVYKRPKQSSVLKSINENRLMTDREIANAEKDISKRSEDTSEAAKKHVSLLERKLGLQRKLVDAQNLEKDIHEKIIDISSKESKPGTGEWQREQIVKNAKAKAAGLNLLSNLGSKIEESGFISSMGGFYKDVAANKDLSKLGKFKTAVLGTFAGIATGTSILMQSLSKFFVYLEIAIATLSMLSLVFGKNSKEVDDFNNSITTLNESIKNAEAVNKQYTSSLSPESILARANAFSSLTDAIKDSSNALNKADEAASFMDRVMDTLKGVIGTNLRTQFTKGLSESIISALQAVPEGKLRTELEDKFKKATGLISLDRESLKTAFNALSNQELKDVGANISSIVIPINDTLKHSQAIVQDIKETSKAVNESYLSLKNSVSDKSPVTAFLQNSIKQAQAFKNALKDTFTAQTAFKSLVSGEVKPEFLTKEVALAIMPLAEEATKLSRQGENYANSLSTAKTRLAEIDKEVSSISSAGWGDGLGVFSETERNQVLAMISSANKGISDIDIKIRGLADQTEKLISKSIVNQISNAIQQTKLKLSQIDVQSKQTALSKLPVKTEASIKYEADLQREAINIEKLLFNSQENLVRSIDLLAIQVQREADLREIAYIKSQGHMTPQQIERVAQLDTGVKSSDKLVQAYSSRNLDELSKLAIDNPAARNLLSSVQGSIEAAKQFASRLKNVDLSESLNRIDLQFSEAIKASEKTVAEQNIALEKISGLTGEKFRDEREQIQKIINAELLKQKVSIPGARDAAITSAVSPYLKDKEGRAVVSSVQAKLEQEKGTQLSLQAGTMAATEESTRRKNEIQALSEKYEIEKRTRDINEEANKLQDNRIKSSIIFSKEEINSKIQSGALDEASANQQLIALDLMDAELDKNIKLRQANDQLATDKGNYDIALQEAGGIENDLLKSQRLLYESTYSSAVQGAEDAYKSQVKLLRLREDMNKREIAYADVFKQAFKDMENAIVEFTKTGKLNFSSMIDSFLEGLLRFEIQQMQASMFKGLNLGNSLATWVNSFGVPPGKAKGAAYDTYGVEAYAKGGTFTNSIVASPTLFRFAHGTGLMGEAGPEAIMPLKRDNQGNLGVRTNQQETKVDVVVNNYTSAKATTKESTDSRGNRKIEVIIGDMVAGELTRNGSSTQQAMLTGYNARPVTTRR